MDESAALRREALALILAQMQNRVEGDTVAAFYGTTSVIKAPPAQELAAIRARLAPAASLAIAACSAKGLTALSEWLIADAFALFDRSTVEALQWEWVKRALLLQGKTRPPDTTTTCTM